MEYLAKLTEEDGRWLVDFPDCPGCQTFGDTKEDAIAAAREALEGWLETGLEHGDVPPKPAPRRGVKIRIGAQLEASLRLRWFRADAGLTQGQLASLVGVSQQQIAKLENPGANPTIGTLEAITSKLGVMFHLGDNEPWSALDIGIAPVVKTVNRPNPSGGATVKIVKNARANGSEVRIVRRPASR